MEFIKKNIISILFAVVMTIVLLRACGGCGDSSEPTQPPVVIVEKDTVWYHTDSTVYREPEIIKTTPYPVEKLTIEYLPDTNHERLLKQYIDLTTRYLATTIAIDSIRIDSIGYVKIKDSISKNAIASRSVSYNFKYPTIKVKETVTLKEEPRRQVFIGGGVMVAPSDVTSLGALGRGVVEPNLGIMYKDKKNRMVGVNAGINGQGVAQYGVSTYVKIGKRP